MSGVHGQPRSIRGSGCFFFWLRRVSLFARHPTKPAAANPCSARIFSRLSFPKKSTGISLPKFASAIYLIFSKKAGLSSPAFACVQQPNRAQPPGIHGLTQQNLCHFVALVLLKDMVIAKRLDQFGQAFCIRIKLLSNKSDHKPQKPIRRTR